MPAGTAYRPVMLAKDCPIAIIPITRESGVISEESELALTGLQGDAEEERSHRLTEASSNDEDLEDYHFVKGSFRLTLSAVRMTTDNPLGDTQLATPYVAVVLSGPDEIRKYWGVIENWNGTINMEKNIERLVIMPVATGGDNPLVTPA